MKTLTFLDDLPLAIVTDKRARLRWRLHEKAIIDAPRYRVWRWVNG